MLDINFNNNKKRLKLNLKSEIVNNEIFVRILKVNMKK